MALIILIENSINTPDNGKCAVGIFLTYKKHLILWITLSFFLINYIATVCVVLRINGS